MVGYYDGQYRVSMNEVSSSWATILTMESRHHNEILRTLLRTRCSGGKGLSCVLTLAAGLQWCVVRKRCLSSLVTKFVTFSSLLSPSLSPFFLVSLLTKLVTFSSRPHHCNLYGHHQVTAGRWHQVQVHRKLRNGSLQLDDQEVDGPTTSILIVFTINYARLSIFYHQPR